MPIEPSHELAQYGRCLCKPLYLLTPVIIFSSRIDSVHARMRKRLLITRKAGLGKTNRGDDEKKNRRKSRIARLPAIFGQCHGKFALKNGAHVAKAAKPREFGDFFGRERGFGKQFLAPTEARLLNMPANRPF